MSPCGPGRIMWPACWERRSRWPGTLPPRWYAWSRTWNLTRSPGCVWRWTRPLSGSPRGEGHDAAARRAHMDAALLARGAVGADIYLDVASGVTVLILLGRYFEARAKRRAGTARRPA